MFELLGEWNGIRASKLNHPGAKYHCHCEDNGNAYLRQREVSLDFGDPDPADAGSTIMARDGSKSGR